MLRVSCLPKRARLISWVLPVGFGDALPWVFLRKTNTEDQTLSSLQLLIHTESVP